jgi:hypothetical protein
VVGLHPIAGGPDPINAGAHLTVDHHRAACSQWNSGAGGQLGGGHRPNGQQHHLGVNQAAITELHSQSVPPSLDREQPLVEVQAVASLQQRLLQ